MQPAYRLPNPLPWAEIAGPLAAAEDALARLDERLSKSPIRDGWIARVDFADAVAALWLEGELVDLEDLVLHDARMDIRPPTHALTRAHAVLRARRRIFANEPGWGISEAGLDVLRGRSAVAGAAGGGAGQGDAVGEDFDGDEDSEHAEATGTLLAPLEAADPDDAWAADMAAIDALTARTALAVPPAAVRLSSVERNPSVYDRDWNEDERLAAWRVVVDATENWPPVLAAAIASVAWNAIEPLQHSGWLGRQLAAALLRARRKARAHVPGLNVGLRAIPQERRRARGGGTHALLVEIDAVRAAAEAGLKDHDRWILARELLTRKCAGKRSTSKLPDLVTLALATPLLTAGMIAKALGVSPRAAQDLVAELGLREATGKARYRAWGIL